MTGIMVNISKRWGYHGVDALRKASPGYLMLLGAFALLAVAGAAVGLHGMIVGYHHVYGVSREVSWGILISAYVFCVVTSTGLCIISSIGHVFGGEAFMPIAKRAVFMSIIFMLGGFCIIFFDIENPFRMAIYNVISPNLSSNMWWMGTLYGAYLVFMVIEYYFLLEQNHSLSRLMGFFGLVVGIAAHSNLGAVFGMLHGRPFWYGPYLPIYFIFSAAMSGGCAIMFVTTLAWKINPEIMNQRMERAMKAICQVTIFLISTIIFFTIWKIVTGIVSHEKTIVIMSLVTGDYAINFWLFEVFLGMLLPLFLLIRSRGNNFNMIMWATGLMMVGIFFMRYDIVIPGQMVSVYHALGVEEARDLVKYTPSFHEIMAALFGLSVICFAYFAGEKMLNGHQLEKHEIVPEGGYICPGCGAIHFMEEGETVEDAMKRHHKIW
ncbi:MAG: polysulfide reductase NrfD [Desulfoarculaceae bacterium]|nr:polysulfide reductase NrfD [Desulfoarculaceae bacterium]